MSRTSGIIGALALSAGALTAAGCGVEPDEVAQRARWMAAEPREPSESSGAAEDRCDLYPWAEQQLLIGMTPDEVVSAIGAPDEEAVDQVSSVWIWHLGACGFIDFDEYAVAFEDGSLTDFGYRPG